MLLKPIGGIFLLTRKTEARGHGTGWQLNAGHISIAKWKPRPFIETTSRARSVGLRYRIMKIIWMWRNRQVCCSPKNKNDLTKLLKHKKWEWLVLVYFIAYLLLGCGLGKKMQLWYQIKILVSFTIIFIDFCKEIGKFLVSSPDNLGGESSSWCWEILVVRVHLSG